MTNIEILEELYEIRERRVKKGLDTTTIDAKISEVLEELNKGNK